mgnify:CR=1 FL=1
MGEALITRRGGSAKVEYLNTNPTGYTSLTFTGLTNPANSTYLITMSYFDSNMRGDVLETAVVQNGVMTEYRRVTGSNIALGELAVTPVTVTADSLKIEGIGLNTSYYYTGAIFKIG